MTKKHKEFIEGLATPELTGRFAEIATIIEAIESDFEALMPHLESSRGPIEGSLRGLKINLAALSCFHASGSIFKEHGGQL